MPCRPNLIRAEPRRLVWVVGGREGGLEGAGVGGTGHHPRLPFNSLLLLVKGEKKIQKDCSAPLWLIIASSVETRRTRRLRSCEERECDWLDGEKRGERDVKKVDADAGFFFPLILPWYYYHQKQTPSSASHHSDSNRYLVFFSAFCDFYFTKFSFIMFRDLLIVMRSLVKFAYLK